MAKRIDLLVHGHGPIYLLRPTSRRGRRWVDVRIAADRTEWAAAIVVEHCFISDIVHGALARGLRVRE
jgi:hypothetical protein